LLIASNFYFCPANVWTIGWGHTGGVKQGQKITQAQVDALRKSALLNYLNANNSIKPLPSLIDGIRQNP
jgi:lysozyme